MRLRAVSRSANKTNGRRGAATFELLLVLPILLIVILAGVQFSMLLSSRQHLAGASREGARLAAQGADQSQVEEIVRRYLGDTRLQDAEVWLTNSEGETVHSGQDVPVGQAVEVWVRVPAAKAAPNLLKWIGLSNHGDEVVARTVMRRE
jgi:hypothetical protein